MDKKVEEELKLLKEQNVSLKEQNKKNEEQISLLKNLVETKTEKKDSKEIIQPELNLEDLKKSLTLEISSNLQKSLEEKFVVTEKKVLTEEEKKQKEKEAYEDDVNEILNSGI